MTFVPWSWPCVKGSRSPSRLVLLSRGRDRTLFFIQSQSSERICICIHSATLNNCSKCFHRTFRINWSVIENNVRHRHRLFPRNNVSSIVWSLRNYSFSPEALPVIIYALFRASNMPKSPREPNRWKPSFRKGLDLVL